jgi:putative NIF3 family GTP cyclohydrolase 1 type 2
LEYQALQQQHQQLLSISLSQVAVAAAASEEVVLAVIAHLLDLLVVEHLPNLL